MITPLMKDIGAAVLIEAETERGLDYRDLAERVFVAMEAEREPSFRECVRTG